ncbi:UNVERIFIED_CONTAM: hypothetical protein Sindi_1871300 [Sesamum indicum]
MASTCTSALFIVALLLFTTHGHGQLLPGLVVNGRLCCTSTGNCPGQGVNGTVVKLNCTNLLGVSTTVGQSTTNTTGSFSITVPRLISLVAGIPTIPCVVTVQLPLKPPYALCFPPPPAYLPRPSELSTLWLTPH